MPGWQGCLDPGPLHVADTSNCKVGDLIESGGGEVEIGEGTAFTPICKGDNDTLALVGYPDLPAAHGVVVGVGTVIAGESIKEQVGNGCNVVGVLVDDSASTKTGRVESTLAALDTGHEAWGATTTT